MKNKIGMECIIRAVTARDFAGIQNIHRDCDDPWRDPDECAAWLGKRLERGFSIRAAALDGKIVGHAEWVVSDEPRGKFLYLGMLQIDADFQGRGIGRKMLDDGMGMARELGCAKLVTMPEADTTSNVFYQKCGFIEGRKIKSVTLPAGEYGYAQSFAAAGSAPFSVVRERPFVFGAVQASSRHVWEVHNQKPATDDRSTAAMVSGGGDCMQLGWFPGSGTALAVYWGEPGARCVEDMLSFGKQLGLQNVLFVFFEEYAALFSKFDAVMEDSNLEIYKII